MPLPLKLINLKHFIINSLEGINEYQTTNSKNSGLEELEESMFIGSVFCSDLLQGINKEDVGSEKRR